MSDDEIFVESEALSRVADDRELLKQIFKAFVQDFPLQIEKLRNAIHDNDMQSAQATAHTISGSTASLSAKRSSNVARAVEAHVKEGDLDRAGELTDRLERELASLITLAGERGLY